MRKFIGLMVVAALAALSLAGTAAASSNLANETVITGTSPAVRLGNIITCEGTVSGRITNDAAGRGAHGALSSASFTSCDNGTVSVTRLPWTMALNTSTSAGAIWDGSVTGITVDVIVLGVHCEYTGGVGAQYSNATMAVTLSGSLTSTNGFPCTSPSAVTGVFDIRPTLTLS